jgi:hypothetical protein
MWAAYLPVNIEAPLRKHIPFRKSCSYEGRRTCSLLELYFSLPLQIYRIFHSRKSICRSAASYFRLFVVEFRLYEYFASSEIYL